MRHRLFTVASLACLGSLLTGCGGPVKPSNRAVAAGTVTYNGAPLPAGTIGFQAADGITKTSAMIKGGQFQTDRAPLGELSVTVDTASIQLGNPPAYVPIPERYLDPETSGLKATITESGATDLKFELVK